MSFGSVHSHFYLSDGVVWVLDTLSQDFIEDPTVGVELRGSGTWSIDGLEIELTNHLFSNEGEGDVEDTQSIELIVCPHGRNMHPRSDENILVCDEV